MSRPQSNPPGAVPDPDTRSSLGDSLRRRRLDLLDMLASGGRDGDATAPDLAHEIARFALAYAATLRERTAAIQVAVSLGMSLNQIEEYLDWLDANRPLLA